MGITQAELISKFNKDKRRKFNPFFFERSDDAIIQELKNIILSAQRNSTFTIKVESFRVIEDYAEILKTLHDYEQISIDRSKSKKKDNKWDFINLKDSDVKLLVVNYYIAINHPDKVAVDKNGNPKKTSDRVTVYIMVPRIVDKYYFRINGNLYSAIYQVVDASTYNNSTSNSAKSQTVTFKNAFMPVRISRLVKEIRTITGEVLTVNYYNSNIFNKSVSALKYILGKKGLLGAINFLGIDHIEIYDIVPDLDHEQFYVFNSKNVFISIPKFLFDNCPVIQSFIYTIYHSIAKDTTSDMLYTSEFWLKSLGSNYITNGTIEKGLAVLDSLESIYDISAKKSLHLRPESKEDIYCILRWMVTNFNSLRLKDNLDVTTKRIRFEEYIATLYALKISPGIYRISDLGGKADIDTIKKAIITAPEYLLTSITKCKFVNYRNMVNDMDAITALKFTYKGIAGIGEKANSVAQIYRNVDISHIGRIDPDTSSNSDPGLTGSLCPFTKIYDKSFTEFMEPDDWDQKIAELISDYHKLIGMKEVAIARIELLNNDSDEELIQSLDESISMLSRLIEPIKRIENLDNLISNEFDLFGDGYFYVSKG